MGVKDVDEILTMEISSSFIPWSRNMFIEEILNPISHCFIMKLRKSSETHAVGYICFRNLVGESELLNLCVHPRYRQMGFGKGLMKFYIDFSTEMDVRASYLDVSASNEPAIHLYHLFSYHVIGTRKRFYHEKVDALLMMREFPQQQ